MTFSLLEGIFEFFFYICELAINVHLINGYLAKKKISKYCPVPLFKGKQISTAVPSLCSKESQVWFLVLAFLGAFGFQCKLAFAGLSSGTPVFLLHLKLGQKWSEGLPGNRYLTLSEATHCKYGLLKLCLFLHLFLFVFSLPLRVSK